MKKCYTFSSKNWLRASLFTAFAFSFSLNLQAQTAPAKLWDKTFGGSDSDFLLSVQQTSDGGYIMGGMSHSPLSADKSQFSKGGEDYWIVKLDSSGNKQWDKTYGGNGDDVLYSLQQTSDGGYILGGHSKSGITGDKSQSSQGSWDFWVVKLDVGGNKIWDKTYGGSGDDQLYSLKQTADGGYIAGGFTNSGMNGDKSQASKGGADYWVVKLDASGNKTWDKTLGGVAHEHFQSLQQTSDGGYILGGYSNSDSYSGGDKSQNSRGKDDYWIVKLDASGNKMWDKTYGGSDSDYLYSLQQTSDGGYILGGWSFYSNISGDKSQPCKGWSDYWVVKIDASGNKTWDKTLGGSGMDGLHTLQQTSDGGYILGGHSESPISGDKSQACQGSPDYWMVKLDGSGNKIWDKTFGGNNRDELRSLQQTSDGGYILAGASESGLSTDKSQPNKGQANTYDYWIIKLAASVTGIKEAETGLAISIFPNPSQSKFNLQLSGLTAPTVGVIVSDLLGRAVLQQELQVTDQQISQELTLPKAKGIYLLQLKTGKQITTRKIVVE